MVSKALFLAILGLVMTTDCITSETYRSLMLKVFWGHRLVRAASFMPRVWPGSMVMRLWPKPANVGKRWPVLGCIDIDFTLKLHCPLLGELGEWTHPTCQNIFGTVTRRCLFLSPSRSGGPLCWSRRPRRPNSCLSDPVCAGWRGGRRGGRGAK